MKLPLLLFFVFIISSCAKEVTKADHLSDDYVLIEFAASLEEEYEKLYPNERNSKVEKPGSDQ